MELMEAEKIILTLGESLGYVYISASFPTCMHCTLTALGLQSAYNGEHIAQFAYPYFQQETAFSAPMASIKDNDVSNRPVYIFTDNQATIRSSRRPKNQAGQYMLKRIVELNETLKRDITIQWIPAHIGVPGNEPADIAAKEATGWRKEGIDSQTETPSSLQTIISAIKSITRKHSRFQWGKAWDTDRHGRTSHRLAQVPHKENPNNYRGLIKAESAILLHGTDRKTRTPKLPSPDRGHG